MKIALWIISAIYLTYIVTSFLGTVGKAYPAGTTTLLAAFGAISTVIVTWIVGFLVGIVTKEDN